MKQHKEAGPQRDAGDLVGGAGAAGKRTLTDQLDGVGTSSAVPHQGQMEAAFGTSFGGVSAAVGTPEAKQALDARGANAAAVGNKVYFADANPSQELVGHELAHTVQQGAVAGRGQGGGGDAEREADQAGHAAARGERAAVSSSSALGVPQFSLRDELRDQHDKRGKDPAATPGVGAPTSFGDMGKDDKGPQFHHDHGFLDDGHGGIDESKRQDPTWGDRLERAKWIAKLEAAELLRPDLVDGTSAYRHFLFGNGATRDVHYARFLNNDNAGHVVLQSAMDDARDAAIRRHDSDVAGQAPAPGTRSYKIRTDIIPVGSSNGRYPYPTTENWQKAIGAHSIWIEANVTVEVRAVAGAPAGGTPTYERHFHVDMTIHAEDMYNFNPGAADIATGTPDAANGRFEITGLGREYLNQGTYARAFDVTTSMAPAPTGPSGPAVDPGRAPRQGSAEGGRGRAAER
jgi:hypothetical protein